MKAAILALVASISFSATPARADSAEAAAAIARQDYGAAYLELLPSAELGDPGSQWQLAELYWYGRGVKKDLVEAARWYLAAAERGHADAQYSIGFMFVLGLGVEQDKTRAAHWFRLAADQGEPNAQVDLGIMYDSGEGVPMNREAALLLYREAISTLRERSAKADPIAQILLGEMYEKGLGVEVDLGMTAMLFLMAANAGDAAAQFRVGELHRVYAPDMTKYTGNLPPPSPLPRDAAEAYKWYALAAAGGYPIAAKYRDLMASELTREQRAASDAWVEAWRPSPPTAIRIE